MKEDFNDFTIEQEKVILGVYKALDLNEQKVYDIYDDLVNATLNGDTADVKQTMLDSIVMAIVELCDLKQDLDNADLRWDTICS